MRTKLILTLLIALIFGTVKNLYPSPEMMARSSGFGKQSPHAQEGAVIRSQYYFHHDGYIYASRIRRFYRPVVGIVMNYFDPIYTDIYWYDHSPYWGRNIYLGLPYWYYTPYYSTIIYHTPVYYWDDFYYPYHRGIHISFNIGYPHFRNYYYAGYGGYWGSFYYVRPVYRVVETHYSVFHTPYYYSDRDRYYSYKTYTRGPSGWKGEGTYRRDVNVNTDRYDRPVAGPDQGSGGRRSAPGTITRPGTERPDNAGDKDRGQGKDNEPTRTRTRTGWDDGKPGKDPADKDNTPTRTRTGWDDGKPGAGPSGDKTPVRTRTGQPGQPSAERPDKTDIKSTPRPRNRMDTPSTDGRSTTLKKPVPSSRAAAVNRPSSSQRSTAARPSSQEKSQSRKASGSGTGKTKSKSPDDGSTSGAKRR